jgi:hypothetical protein
LKESAVVGGATISAGIGMTDFYFTSSKANQLWDEATGEVEKQGILPPDSEALRQAQLLAESPGEPLLRFHSMEEIRQAQDVFKQQENHSVAVRQQYRTKDERPSPLRQAVGGSAALIGTGTFIVRIQDWYDTFRNWRDKISELKGSR